MIDMKSPMTIEQVSKMPISEIEKELLHAKTFLSTTLEFVEKINANVLLMEKEIDKRLNEKK